MKTINFAGHDVAVAEIESVNRVKGSNRVRLVTNTTKSKRYFESFDSIEEARARIAQLFEIVTTERNADSFDPMGCS